MIDPISAFAAVSAASSAISNAVKAGKDLHSLSGQFGNTKAEAELNVRGKSKEEQYLLQDDWGRASRNR